MPTASLSWVVRSAAIPDRGMAFGASCAPGRRPATFRTISSNRAAGVAEAAARWRMHRWLLLRRLALQFDDQHFKRLVTDIFRQMRRGRRPHRRARLYRRILGLAVGKRELCL